VAFFDTLHLVLVEISESEALATRDFTNGRPKLRQGVCRRHPSKLVGVIHCPSHANEIGAVLLGHSGHVIEDIQLLLSERFHRRWNMSASDYV
ncbi:hypothetical protein, partial [Pseudomonas aeruginosa]|uniref:hypothetical protein n=2 Tax=Pseudomonas aeruginosa TaxID=287 RepID=UPI003004F6D6